MSVITTLSEALLECLDDGSDVSNAGSTTTTLEMALLLMAEQRKQARFSTATTFGDVIERHGPTSAWTDSSLRLRELFQDDISVVTTLEMALAMRDEIDVVSVAAPSVVSTVEDALEVEVFAPQTHGRVTVNSVRRDIARKLARQALLFGYTNGF